MRQLIAMSFLLSCLCCLPVLSAAQNTKEAVYGDLETKARRMHTELDSLQNEKKNKEPLPLHVTEYPLRNKPKTAPVYKEPSAEAKVAGALDEQARQAAASAALENLCPRGDFDCEDFMYLVDANPQTRAKRRALYDAAKEDFLEAKNHMKMRNIGRELGGSVSTAIIERNALARALGPKGNDVNGVIAMFGRETFTVPGLKDNLKKLCALCKQNKISGEDRNKLSQYIGQMQAQWELENWRIIGDHKTNPYHDENEISIDVAFSCLTK